MHSRRFLYAILLTAVLSVVAQAQDAVRTLIPTNDLFESWDNLNQRILYHRTSLKPKSANVYAADTQGKQTLAIDVLKDFPGALHSYVGLSNVAGGPQGDVVLFCLLDYGDGLLKDLILNYSSSGVLKGVIDAGPYEAGALTVDELGNIYMFGSNYQYQVDDPKAVYPAVVKFGPDGHVLQTMLLLSNFSATGDYPADSSKQNGPPLLAVTPRGIEVFAASSGRWFLLSQQGEIIAQKDLSRITARIAHQFKFRRASVMQSFLEPNGLLVLAVRLDDGPFDKRNVPPPDKMRFESLWLRVDPSSMALMELARDGNHEGKRIVGIGRDGNPVHALCQQDGSLRLEY
jgi:hypothetical protein